MRLVLLSGGSGKRLWPLSNDSRSKQFLKVLMNADGTSESMVQRVWGQIESVGLAGSAYIATSKAQVEVLQSQLGYDVPIIVEPERRDTFPAIALAATYLYAIEGISLNETIVILPVDPYVEEGFFQKVKDLEPLIEKTSADLALIGVKPTYPSEKYGYIIPKETTIDYEDTSYLTVNRFQEKPSSEEAIALIQEAALWNCGVFAFKLNYLIDMLIDMGLPIQYEQMIQQYNKLPKISFDYQVVEKAKHIVVAPYNGDWRDLGTWNTLTEEMGYNVLGKGIVSHDSINSHLINELEIPVAILGLSNIIVATSPDGILVTDKSASPRVKELLDGMNNRPMYEERRWGHYRVIDYVKYTAGNEVLTKRICIKQGCHLSYQYHEKRDEVWTIVAGEGELILNEHYQKVAAGDVIRIPQGSRHSIKGLIDLEIIEIQTGSELVEEDIIRLSMDWIDILEKCV